MQIHQQDLPPHKQGAPCDMTAQSIQLADDGIAIQAQINAQLLKADLSVHDHADEQVCTSRLCLLESLAVTPLHTSRIYASIARTNIYVHS